MLKIGKFYNDDIKSIESDPRECTWVGELLLEKRHKDRYCRVHYFDRSVCTNARLPDMAKHAILRHEARTLGGSNSSRNGNPICLSGNDST